MINEFWSNRSRVEKKLIIGSVLIIIAMGILGIACSNPLELYSVQATSHAVSTSFSNALTQTQVIYEATKGAWETTMATMRSIATSYALGTPIPGLSTATPTPPSFGLPIPIGG